MVSFTRVDYAVVIVYLLASIGIGVWFSRKQKSIDDYFVASRSAPWWAVGISVIATNLSAISYLAVPAWIFSNDLQLDAAIVLFPIAMLLVVYLFVPFLAKLRLYTIYEYLEKRFNLSTRTFASALFLLLRGGWLATATYAQAMVLTELTSLPTTTCIWITGGATALYTVLGGIEAVLWTDFMQFFVLVGGLVAIITVAVLSFSGDVGQIWALAAQDGNTRFINFDFGLDNLNIFAIILGLFVINVSSYGSDQLIVQRYLTTSNKKSMTKAVMFNGFLTVGVVAMLCAVGLCLVSYYKVNPAVAGSLKDTDRIIPHFIGNVLPVGLSGLVVAGIFAATMSSVSAGYNSLSTASIIDFYKRFRERAMRPTLSNRRELIAARIMTLVWAGAATTAAQFVDRLGSIIEIIMKINGFFTGPLLAIFLLGILTKRAKGIGVLVGAVLGTACTWWVSTTDVYWLWYGPVGLVSTFIIGYLISLFVPVKSPVDEKEPMTIWNKDTYTEVLEEKT